MEIEADQFAMYVLKHGNLRLTAGTDMIVRLARGDVPVPVRQGDGWAGYLQTHPANDLRFAAMQSTLNRVRSGAVRPLSKAEREVRDRQKVESRKVVEYWERQLNRT